MRDPSHIRSISAIPSKAAGSGTFARRGGLFLRPFCTFRLPLAAGGGILIRQLETGPDGTVHDIAGTPLITPNAGDFFVKCFAAAGTDKSSFVDDRIDRFCILISQKDLLLPAVFDMDRFMMTVRAAGKRGREFHVKFEAGSQIFKILYGSFFPVKLFLEQSKARHVRSPSIGPAWINMRRTERSLERLTSRVSAEIIRPSISSASMLPSSTLRIQ